MESIVTYLSIILSMGISLGVGSSTLAILNFFHAISDGKIEETERNFMGVTYTVLRVAMGIILVTLSSLTVLGYFEAGTAYFTPHVTFQALLVGVLFINAFLMTARIMPSTFGPAIQASAWYSLGLSTALLVEGVASSWSLLTFILFYVALAVLATSIVNGVMAFLKNQH